MCVCLREVNAHRTCVCVCVDDRECMYECACARQSLSLSLVCVCVYVLRAFRSYVCRVPEHKSIPIQPVKEKKSGVEQQQQRLALNVNLPTQPVKEKKSGVEQKKEKHFSFLCSVIRAAQVIYDTDTVSTPV